MTRLSWGFCVGASAAILAVVVLTSIPLRILTYLEIKGAIEDASSTGFNRANGGVWQRIRPLLLGELRGYRFGDQPKLVYAWANRVHKDSRIAFSTMWISSAWGSERVNAIVIKSKAGNDIVRRQISDAEYQDGGSLMDSGPVFELTIYVPIELAAGADSVSIECAHEAIRSTQTICVDLSNVMTNVESHPDDPQNPK